MLDLVHNPHKLEVERKEAYEYRKKFYPTQGGYMGQGSGSVGSSSYQPSYTPSYQSSSGGDAGKVYTPYSSDPIDSGMGSSSTTTNKWGPENLNASSTQQIGGSTYNITNNNNINYNYGSNITAISSEGSVPTF